MMNKQEFVEQIIKAGQEGEIGAYVRLFAEFIEQRVAEAVKEATGQATPQRRELNLEESDSTRYFRMVEWLVVIVEKGRISPMELPAIRQFLREEGRLD